MPFRLKNAGATYQKVMVTLFHDLMHKKVKVYMNDMITKSPNESENMDDLWKLFKQLCKCQLKLNPTKWTFSITSGKLLGFIMSEQGIEIDLDKVKAIQNLSLLHTQKKVKSSLERLDYIARFIS